MKNIWISVKNINFIRLATRLLVVFSVFVLAGTAYFVYTIDVIEDSTWRLVLPKDKSSEKKPIHAGDTIIVQSIYEKKRNVTGRAERYIECYTEDEVLVTYPINQKKADRAQGKGGTGLELLMPIVIPNLPSKCRIRVSIEYPVLPFRTVTENKNSEEFLLLPARKDGDGTMMLRESESVSSPQSTTSPVQSSVQYSPSSNSTPEPTDDAVTKSTEQPKAQEESLLERITGIIRASTN